jgi:hypothetical protein
MRIITAGLILTIFFACSSGKKTEEQEFMAGLDTTKAEGPSISEEVIGDILQSIPAPLEIAVLLKESGKKYNASYLNSTDNISRYNSNYKKALNMGIYGTDLGYTNIYEQNQDGIKYMGNIKELADGLNIGQFFEIETIGRLATNSKNLDSLLLITTQNFNSINHYLQTQSRANLSVLLLTGGWLEALHVLCEVAKANPGNKEMEETIGEQKIILENIVLLLSFYKESDPNMASLLNDMEGLKKSFEKVNITYTYKESTFEIVDGVMVIKDNSTSTIEITPKDVEDISSITKSIRSKIIS